MARVYICCWIHTVAPISGEPKFIVGHVETDHDCRELEGLKAKLVAHVVRYI